MPSSDAIFPSGVIDAPGSPKFVPTGNLGPRRRRSWGHREAAITETWETPQEARHRIAEIVASGVGNPLTPGSKGNYTRRVKGILVNPTTETTEDAGEGTDEVHQDEYTPGSVDGRVAIQAVRRSGEAVAPDEVVEHDPFGGAGRAVVVARSGNEDPDGDEFTQVGSGSPKRGLKGLGEGLTVSKPVSVVILAAVVVGVYLLVRKRR